MSIKIPARLLLIAACMALIVASCKKTKIPDKVFMKSKVGNTLYNFNFCGATWTGNFVSVIGNSYTTSASQALYPMIELRLWKFTESNYVFNFGGPADSSAAFLYRSATDTAQAVSGIVNITWIGSMHYFADYGFQGNFYFTLPDSTKFTNGSFYTGGGYYTL
jgi:predicted ATP-dependent Lon-type protease